MSCGAGVLVGGAGSRMGASVPKPLLGFGPGVVLDHVLARVVPQVKALCLCAHDDCGEWARFGLPVAIDGAEGARLGPLAGILAGLNWAAAQGFASLLVVPGDTPFIPHNVLARLGEAPAVAEAGGRVHHLVCHLPVMSRPILAAALARGHSRVGQVLEALGARRVAFAEAADFININTPQDYREARERLAGAALSQSMPP